MKDNIEHLASIVAHIPNDKQRLELCMTIGEAIVDHEGFNWDKWKEACKIHTSIDIKV